MLRVLEAIEYVKINEVIIYPQALKKAIGISDMEQYTSINSTGSGVKLNDEAKIKKLNNNKRPADVSYSNTRLKK